MKYVYVGKEVVSDSLKARAEKKLSKMDRYFNREAEALIRFRQQRGGRNIAEVTVSVDGADRQFSSFPECESALGNRYDIKRINGARIELKQQKQ